jgi:hypothetical protein
MTRKQKGIPKVWTDEKVAEALRPIVAELGGMPSAQELDDRGLCGLRASISMVHGGVRSVAHKHGFSMRDSCTKRGLEIEDKVTESLRAMGFSAERQSMHAPFDILVNGRVRVDVKSARYTECRSGRSHVCRGHVFGIAKADPTCDLYILCGVDAANAILWRYFVPSSEARVRTLTITPTGQTYTRFREDIGQLRRLCGIE